MELDIKTYTRFGPFYEQLLSDIRAARHHIFVQFFKFEPDAIGQRLGALMARKAREGLDVRLMYDDFVCRHWRWYYRHLNSQGIHTAGFAPLHKPLPHPSDYYRNHRKTIIIDGQIGYLGGMNIAERYLHGLDWGHWRDTMLRIQNPAVSQLQHCYLDDWQSCTHHPTTLPAYYPYGPDASDPAVTILSSNPSRHDLSIMHHTIRLLDTAQRYAWLQSPYFIPTPQVMQALCSAARRGVDIRILQPPRGDRGQTTQWASRLHYAKALDAGVKIGIYNPGFLHSKIIVSDDRLAAVSSCNIDPRSYRLCHEISLIVQNPTYAVRLRDIFLADEAQSTYINPSQWRRRPLPNRIKETLAGAIASQL